VVQELRSDRPIRRLGALAHRSYVTPRPLEAADEPFGPVESNVALLRRQQFVVKYMQVPKDTAGARRAGVFAVDEDDELQELFAASEPVAHDDWNPEYLQQQLPRYGRNPVRVALDKIRTEMRSGTGSIGTDGDDARHPGLARLSGILGRPSPTLRGAWTPASPLSHPPAWPAPGRGARP